MNKIRRLSLNLTSQPPTSFKICNRKSLKKLKMLKKLSPRKAKVAKSLVNRLKVKESPSQRQRKVLRSKWLKKWLCQSYQKKLVVSTRANKFGHQRERHEPQEQKHKYKLNLNLQWLKSPQRKKKVNQFNKPGTLEAKRKN